MQNDDRKIKKRNTSGSFLRATSRTFGLEEQEEAEGNKECWFG